MNSCDFLKLMGKGKRCWKHVKTKRDLADLQEFEDLFVRNFYVTPNKLLIPEILHFVWLGPKEYPAQSKKYLEGWREKHPTWKVFFWSDREKDLVTPSLLKEYQRFYDESDNFGERSDLVRLLVLKEFGGVYVDHDMECRMSFANLHRMYPFYTGLLTPGNPVIQRSAIVRNSIIGAAKDHPILTRALELVKEKWDRVGREHPGKDVTSIKTRVTLRVFSAFHEAVLEQVKDPNFKGIVFPAGCFNEIEREFGLFAKEDMVGAWYTDEMSHHEEYLKNRLHHLMKRMHLFMGVVAFAIIILLSLIILLWMRLP